MSELYLKFTSPNGKNKRILVEEEKFIIGRHSDNDLCILNSKLSRQHIEIERFAEVFVVSDLGSSNGTTLNGEPLDEPVSLQDEDVLNLGGDFKIEVELDSDIQSAQDPSQKNEDEDDSENQSSDANVNSNAPTQVSSSSSSAQSSGGFSMGTFFILASFLGIFLLVSVFGLIFLFSGKSNDETAQNSINNNEDPIFTTSPNDNSDESPEENINGKPPESTPLPESTQTDVISNNNQNDNQNEPTPTPEIEKSPSTPQKEVDETKQIRKTANGFMRKISQNNSNTVLTQERLSILTKKIKQFKGSSALASNIKNAQNNSSQIRDLASSRGLKPQFLATAALAKLGNNRGDVFTKTQEMAETLRILRREVSGEFADDSLLAIAVYNQGVKTKIKSTLQILAQNDPTATPRRVRTIWFLRKKGKLNSAEFDLALSFLAIGTITQNPKAFNVNTNALVLN